MNGRGTTSWIFTVLRWAVLVLLTAAAAQAQPPIHQVGDHWSAWDGPTEAPEGYEVYVIQPGDTLWAVAEQLLGDPYLWPQLWEENKYILDARWIYPGDILIVPSGAITGTEGVAGPSIDTDAETGLPSEDDPYAGEGADQPFTLELEEVSETPVPLGYESDIYCTGYVGEMQEEFPYTISGSEYDFLNPTLDPSRNTKVKSLWSSPSAQKLLHTQGDIVYVKGGSADGLSAGMLLTVIEPEDEPLVHPLTKKVVGRFYAYTGRLRVLSVQEDQSIAEIVALCDPVLVGSVLKPFEPEPVPLRRITPMRPINLPHPNDVIDAGPTIIGAYDGVVTIGAGHLVYIDRGYDEDVAPGDIFTIYRRTRGDFPAVLLGELGVITSYKNSSLARVYRSRYSIFTGDKLVLK